MPKSGFAFIYVNSTYTLSRFYIVFNILSTYGTHLTSKMMSGRVLYFPWQFSTHFFNKASQRT